MTTVSRTKDTRATRVPLDRELRLGKMIRNATVKKGPATRYSLAVRGLGQKPHTSLAPITVGTNRFVLPHSIGAKMNRTASKLGELVISAFLGITRNLGGAYLQMLGFSTFVDMTDDVPSSTGAYSPELISATVEAMKSGYLRPYSPSDAMKKVDQNLDITVADWAQERASFHQDSVDAITSNDEAFGGAEISRTCLRLAKEANDLYAKALETQDASDYTAAAQKYSELAIEEVRNDMAPDNFSAFMLSIWAAGLYLEAKKDEEAIETLAEALEYANNYLEEYLKDASYGVDEAIPAVYALIASIYEETGKYADASENYNIASINAAELDQDTQPFNVRALANGIKADVLYWLENEGILADQFESTLTKVLVALTNPTFAAEHVYRVDEYVGVSLKGIETVVKDNAN